MLICDGEDAVRRCRLSHLVVCFTCIYYSSQYDFSRYYPECSLSSPIISDIRTSDSRPAMRSTAILVVYDVIESVTVSGRLATARSFFAVWSYGVADEWNGLVNDLKPE